MKKFPNDHLIVKDIEQEAKGFKVAREYSWKKGIILDANEEELIGREVIFSLGSGILYDKKDNSYLLTEKNIYRYL